MEPLSTWALDWGVVLAEGLQLTEDSVGDWTLTITEPFEQGYPLLTVPSHVILTSDIQDDAYLPYYDENDMRTVYTWMAVEMGEKQPTFQQNYLPEFILIFKVMREVYLGKNSRWYAWWQSLPQTFATGLYLDDIERKFVDCMAGEFLYTQDLQHKAFVGLMRRLLNAQESRKIIPDGMYTWLRQSQHLIDGNGQNLFESLVKWAFTVVFTRSWRSADRQHAQIVPLGDLANHDSQLANLRPLFRPVDGAFQFYLTRDLMNVSELLPGKLYLSYGQSYCPARYLVLFGFCDVSAPYVDAHIDFLEDEEDIANKDLENDGNLWPMRYLDQTCLVISTKSGAMSEEVWIAFLYKVLREKDPEELSMLRKSFESGHLAPTVDGDELVAKLLEKWELTLTSEIRAHYQRLLETDFAPIIVTEQDLLEHPNLSMIVSYNLFMRECFIGVLQHLSEISDPAIPMQDMSTSFLSASFSSQYTANASTISGPRQQSTKSSMSNNTPDTTMDSYAQAFSRLKLNEKARIQTPDQPFTTTISSAGQSRDDTGETARTENFISTKTTATSDSDTSMDAYIRAINNSNGTA
ncbi:hypothetical protein IV203_000379 [Nitzschia inconspicua]|uniref:Rubisco LSMT substrate-binding domain-containing protein n=1 Tax=Nitzschia inconspicua TaxID=303405 RepID=A0A9K3PQL4_9STRA|nr:hypothetical protein IV203_000379 [Nitzschia inconspicua]